MNEELIDRIAEAMFEESQRRTYGRNRLLYGRNEPLSWTYVTTSPNVLGVEAEHWRACARAAIKAMDPPK